jgi:hypothetical protein
MLTTAARASQQRTGAALRLLLAQAEELHLPSYSETCAQGAIELTVRVGLAAPGQFHKVAKFRENAARMLKPGQVEAVIDCVNAIEQTRTLQPLLELCVARER